MLFLFWFLLVLAGSCLFLIMPLILGWPIYAQYRGTRTIVCPQTHGHAVVRIDSLHALLTTIFASEKLRLATCSLWPERANCAQDCIGQAIRLPAVHAAKRETRASRIPHEINYPAVLAATAAYWLVGAFWYSHYLFRGPWMQMMGYEEAQVQRMVLRSVPQLETLLWSLIYCLILAVIIEMGSAHNARKGAEIGFVLWVPVWLVVVVATVYNGWPINMVWLHAGAAMIASVVAGLILGSWSKGRILRSLDPD
jgi:hypothetical protein